MRTKILYIQHAGALGGSCMSLLYTMQGLDHSRFEPILALARPSSELLDFYAAAGFDALPRSGMVLWDHSTVAPKPLYDPRSWLHLWQVWRHWDQTQRLTLELIETVKPDIVHLNSMPLSPCADILSQQDIPFVWHVREPPPDQGLRTQMIRRFMLLAPQLIFISEYDRRAWVDGNTGNIVRNFVDFRTFHSKIDDASVRRRFNIRREDNIIVYLGGIAATKGILVLLKALEFLRRQISNFVCLMPGAAIGPPASWQGYAARKFLPLLGGKTLKQKVAKEIRTLKLEQIVRLLPFSKHIPDLLAAADLLVFPSTQPHFARPVVEAGAMGKASIGSNLGGVNELIDHGRTGLLVEPGSPTALADAIKDLLTNPGKLKSLGDNAYQKARQDFDARKQIAKIIKIYDAILG